MPKPPLRLDWPLPGPGVAAALNHPAYGAAAAAITVDAGPCHEPAASPDVTASNKAAAEFQLAG
ncbi:hypothetical protein AWC22_19160 [Mycobacterium riyadhense]|nr:hypothetical protein AWC22_19160 [Mycobacterium riyadhense]